MSQTAHEKRNTRNSPTSEQKVPPPKPEDLSPDDPIGVSSDDTGKKPAPSPQMPRKIPAGFRSRGR